MAFEVGGEGDELVAVQRATAKHVESGKYATNHGDRGAQATRWGHVPLDTISKSETGHTCDNAESAGRFLNHYQGPCIGFAFRGGMPAGCRGGFGGGIAPQRYSIIDGEGESEGIKAGAAIRGAARDANGDLRRVGGGVRAHARKKSGETGFSDVG